MNSPDTTTKTPLAGYRRIEIDLRAQVDSGRWSVGAMLPSRRDLARQYGVSLVTLDRAIGPLLADGILRADDRRGTFVLKLSGEAPPASSRQTAEFRPFAPANGGSVPEARLADGEPLALYPTLGAVGTVGIITTHARTLGQEYLVLHEMEQVLSQRGISVRSLSLSQSGTAPRTLADTVQAMLQEEVSALLIVCFDIDKAQITADLEQVELGGTPIVCVVAGDLNLPVPHVFYDYRSGGRQAALHLAERGWRDISVIAPFHATWVSERVEGVRDAAAQATAALGSVGVLSGDCPEWEVHQNPGLLGLSVARAAFEAGWKPDGVLCVNDGVAFGVLEAASERGLVAGKDFGIIGFDDVLEAREHGLTSLRPPIQGLAREAARLLLDHMQGMDTGLQVRLRAHVIPRVSTRRREPAAG